jgi:hypothetical protein
MENYNIQGTEYPLYSTQELFDLMNNLIENYNLKDAGSDLGNTLTFGGYYLTFFWENVVRTEDGCPGEFVCVFHLPSEQEDIGEWLEDIGIEWQNDPDIDSQ